MGRRRIIGAIFFIKHDDDIVLVASRLDFVIFPASYHDNKKKGKGRSYIAFL